MSWLDNIKNDLVITTGDGKSYRPHYLNAQKQVEYNVAEFDFPKVTGTLVYRGTPRGTRYLLELYFTGENHLEQARAFELSAADPRAWVISHPMYNRINVQPLGLNFDNTTQNVTKITGTVVETISEDYPKGTISPPDKIKTDAANMQAAVAQAFAISAKPVSSDISKLQLQNDLAYKAGSKYTPADFFNEYRNAYSEANAAVSDLMGGADKALNAVQTAQSLIFAPANFLTNTFIRVNIFKAQALSMLRMTANTPSQSIKYAYQLYGATNIAGLAQAVATPLSGNYKSRKDVYQAIETLLAEHDTYINALSGLQTDNYGAPDSFIPDDDAIAALNSLVNYTVSNLQDIALNAKQERSIINEYDSNWIVLTHRLIGLKPDDSTVVELMEWNNAGINEVFLVKKNRRIVYYV